MSFHWGTKTLGADTRTAAMTGSEIMIAGVIYGLIIGALPNAVNWVSDLLFGPLATAIAIIVIAWFGFSMFWGRINLRRGMSVILGCFLLFGARVTVDGLRKVASNDSLQPMAIAPSSPPAYPTMLPPKNHSNAFDPYAGTAVLPSEQ